MRANDFIVAISEDQRQRFILRLSIHVPTCSAIFGTQQVAFKEQISTKQLTLDVHIVNVEKKTHTKLIEAI